MTARAVVLATGVAYRQLGAPGIAGLVGAVRQQLTGRDLAGKDRAEADQPVPHPLETSMQGVFSVGDMRAGSVKGSPPLSGEGSIAIPQVHLHLLRQATKAAS